MYSNLDNVIESMKISITPKTNVGKAIRSKKDQVFINHCKYIHDSELLIYYEKNRDINKAKVMKMIIGISKNGAVQPITICLTKAGNVIMDGQHRAVVCKFLGYDIPYVSIDQTDLKVPISHQIQAFNTCQKNWTNKDYRKLFKAEKNKFFAVFEDLKENSFPKGTGVDTILSLMCDRKMKMEKIKAMSSESIDSEFDLLSTVYKTNANHTAGLIRTVVSIYDLRSNFYFIKGFAEFLIEQGVRNIDINFLAYLERDAKIFDGFLPQTLTDWKVYFEDKYNDFINE